MNRFLAEIMIRAQADPEATVYFVSMIMLAISIAVLSWVVVCDISRHHAEDKYGWQKVFMANREAEVLEKHDVKIALVILALGMFCSMIGFTIGAWFIKVAQPEIWSIIWPL